MKVHHATVKKAAKLGIEITEKDDQFVLIFDGNRLVTKDAKAGVEQIASWIASEEEGEEPEWTEEGEDEEDEDSDEGKSVVKHRYKKAYRPFKQKCGDELSTLISNHLLVKDEETGEMKIDAVKLKKFARANGCWVDSYSMLNVGMRRMNVRNRLAAIIRKNPDYQIVWN